jgi:hypothetical protein
MPSHLRLVVSAMACAVALVVPAAASAVPPANDNYLASTSISDAQRPLGRMFTDNTVDTTDATTQADLFNPDKDGQPLGGGGPEPTTCGGTSFGKTAWWDFRPQSPGAAEIKASGAFDVVVAVYEWSSSTSKITRTVTCRNADPGSETVQLFDLRKNHNYTVEVGGAGNTGGPVRFSLEYFRDRDGDGVFDAIDDCRSLPGTSKGGCPPTLQAAARLTYDKPGNGVLVRTMTLDDLPKGARAEVRCTRSCGRKAVVKARRAGSLDIRRFVNRFVRAGNAIEIRVTMARQKHGRFRYGGIGKYIRYPVTSAGLGKRVLKCLDPGSRKPHKCR